MPGLADLILAEDDDLDLQDPELAKQLEELQAKRRTAATSAAAAPAASAAQPPASPPAESPAPEAQVSPQRRAQARSLADEILNSASGANVEQELEAMEQELEQQLAAFRKGESPHGKPAGAAELEASAPPAAAPETLEPSPAHSSEDPAGSTNGFGAQPADEEALPPELAKLRTEAAQMEECFPDAQPGEEAPPPPPRPARRQAEHLTRTADREANRAAAPIEESILTMKGDLADLEIRLKALQSKDCLKQPQDAAEAAGDEQAAVKGPLAEIRAQNEHIRRLMQEKGGKGLLGIDRGLFAADKS